MKGRGMEEAGGHPGTGCACPSPSTPHLKPLVDRVGTREPPGALQPALVSRRVLSPAVPRGTYRGRTCLAGDACVPNPCLNGGTCSEDGGRTGCLCLPGYGGSACEQPLHKCHPGWDGFQGACYKHFSTRRSWEDAEGQCRHHGGHLATILTPEEQDFINDQYREYQWIGLNDRTIEGDFQWADGSPLLYENWHPGQPDSYFLSGENCVVMVWHDGGQWSDVPCNYHLSYTCRMGLVRCGPPPTVSNGRPLGRARPHYEVDASVRYRCRPGFAARRSPLARCRRDGTWERPRLLCIPGLAQIHDD